MSPRKRKVLAAIATGIAAAIAFAYGQVSVATESIRFDLQSIGRSVYEAHSKSGKWPTRIDDLNDTEYLKMPYRKTMLGYGAFVVVWQDDLASEPAANRDRVLAYHDRGLLSRFGSVWVCRGDLRTERMSRDALGAYLKER